MILVKSAGVFMHELLPLLWDGTLVTLQITVFGSLLAVVVALVAALGKLSRWPGVKWLAIGFIELFRGTSLLVQLFWLFYVLPLPPFNITLTPYVVAIIGLGLHIGAYGAEILRGAILAVPKGQTEAALSLNISPLQCFTHVVLPQAIIHAIPPGTNLLIELLKKYLVGFINYPVGSHFSRRATRSAHRQYAANYGADAAVLFCHGANTGGGDAPG
ncbi:ectoine/hydroxyectoine ABC transporter permease subunit EhuC [Klebsiella quasipneumoniae subsp. similipneumoniae]|nr:ectoine/hydroxyectoine ABC transporter permease subunit EhuC [Klebsiella quasipneumoniae subsp. similipneumoniae]